MKPCIAIPIFDHGEFIGNVVESLASFDLPCIIVDDGSGAETRAELDRLESESDVLQSELRARLFELESDLPPVNVMFLYKIIDLTGEVADYAERVGRRLELLLAH